MSTKPPGGTRDFLADDVRRREYVIDVVRDVYERYGFEPLETPAFENIETLLGKYGDEGNKLIFKILKRGEHESSGEADLALRYDLTVPLARVVAEHQATLPRFFKRYQIQPVWRADRPARGRFREFYQCDIDTIGTTSVLVEVEQIAAVSEAMTTLGFNDFIIRINHRQLLTQILTALFELPLQSHAEALIALDKLDKIGEEGVARELENRGVRSSAASLQALHRIAPLKVGFPSGEARSLQSLHNRARPDHHHVEAASLRSLHALEREIQAARHPTVDANPIVELRQILDLSGATVAGARLCFDPFLARGLSYYTGAIMEINVPDLAGSLGGGGRYDNLIGMFLGRDIPACGFSLGLERIIVVMTERNMFPANVVRSGVDVMVTIWSHESRADSLTLASELRRSGLRVDVYPEADKPGKQLKYAAARNVPFVAIIGDDERARGEVTIKDMATRDQQSVSRADAARFIASRLRREPRAKNLEPEPGTRNPEPGTRSDG